MHTAAVLLVLVRRMHLFLPRSCRRGIHVGRHVIHSPLRSINYIRRIVFLFIVIISILPLIPRQKTRNTINVKYVGPQPHRMGAVVPTVRSTVPYLQYGCGGEGNTIKLDCIQCSGREIENAITIFF